MSGGVEERFNIKTIVESQKKGELDSLWLILKKARSKRSVICCNLEPDELIPDFRLENGLVKGHAYVVTTLVTLRLKDKKIVYGPLKCHQYLI